MDGDTGVASEAAENATAGSNSVNGNAGDPTSVTGSHTASTADPGASAGAGGAVDDGGTSSGAGTGAGAGAGAGAGNQLQPGSTKAHSPAAPPGSSEERVYDAKVVPDASALYHEQQRRMFCGVHAVNSLLQSAWLAAVWVVVAR